MSKSSFSYIKKPHRNFQFPFFRLFFLNKKALSASHSTQDSYRIIILLSTTGSFHISAQDSAQTAVGSQSDQDERKLSCVERKQSSKKSAHFHPLGSYVDGN